MKRVLAALLFAAAAPVGAQTIAIVNGTVALGDGSQPIPNGTVVIRDGRIVAAGGMRMKLPAGTQVIELRRTRTASGVRYDAFGEPPSTFFWDKGALATVAVEGDTYPECRRVR